MRNRSDIEIGDVILYKFNNVEILLEVVYIKIIDFGIHFICVQLSGPYKKTSNILLNEKHLERYPIVKELYDRGNIVLKVGFNFDDWVVISKKEKEIKNEKEETDT